jgi:hypothetical protein
VISVGAVAVCLVAASVACGFAWGAYGQFRHLVFLHQATVGRDIVEAKMCAQQGCDAVRGWITEDFPLQFSNYSAQYALLNEPFPSDVIDIARNAWSARHSVDEAIKHPHELETAIEKCNCGLHVLQPSGR